MPTVWIAASQLQCCGDPFAVGSRVSWALAPADRDFLAGILGADLAAGVSHQEDHHSDAQGDATQVTGVVRSIRAARCRFAPRPGESPRMLYPVPGTGRLTAVGSADGWDAEEGDLRFTGYVVELEH